MNKVRFIHFRNQKTDYDTNTQVPLIKGGATVAWRFDENGDIQVGAPAVCSIKDNYNKSIGRNYAENNLNSKPLAIVIPKADYMAALDADIESLNNMLYLTKSFVKKVIDDAKATVDVDPLNFVTIKWFEDKVRQVVIFHENHVYTKNAKVFGTK